MITHIYLNGNSCHEQKKQNELIELNNNIHSIAVTFDNQDQANAFAAQFPKSLKVNNTYINSTEGGVQKREPHVSVYSMWTTTRGRENKVTGAVNESGQKRLKRFHEALKIELAKQ